jgi:molybdopterin molybdotransferase
LRAHLAPGPNGIPIATAFERQDSAMLRLLTNADALILRAPNAPATPGGTAVEVIRLDKLGL